MNQFAANLPVNSVSFGQVSVAILRELHRRQLTPSVFPIGGVDMSTQKLDADFNNWLSACINSAQQRHSRKNATLRLWHIGGSLESYSDRGNDLLTFFELDSLTPSELNILRQQRRVWVTSSYTKSVFAMFGINAEYLPLGFDSFNFAPLEKRPTIDGVTSMLLAGKLEARKGHLHVLRLWAKRYGNNKAYRLNCAVHNPFLKPEDQNALIAQALEGKQYWNINFLPFAATNAEYNSVLQSSEIVIAMSGGEGRDLPCFHATALGAWPVAMKAHAYLDYLNDDNAVLVNPNGKQPAHDGIFFNGGGPFNSGNWFTWAEDEFIAACEAAEQRVKSLGLNKKGMELAQQTYAGTVDALLKDL